MSSSYADKSWLEIFKKELSAISDPEIVDIVTYVLINLPTDKCKTAPAASTAKYHPLCSLGDGGTIRHTKFVVQNVLEFVRATPQLEKEKDELIAAAILHDLMKYPSDETFYSRPDHPTLMKDFILKHCRGKKAKTIARLVYTHQGRKEWQKDKSGNIVNKKSPKKFDEWALHYADLLASRVYMNVNFDDNGELVMDSCADRADRVKEVKDAKKAAKASKKAEPKKES